jgi:hypothetical protein
MTEGRVEVDSAYADVMVACPMPGHEADPALPLGEFMQTEVGQRVLGAAVENADRLRSMGMEPEEAIGIALGAGALKDGQGSIVRADTFVAEEASVAPPEASFAEALPKKK